MWRDVWCAERVGFRGVSSKAAIPGFYLFWGGNRRGCMEAPAFFLCAELEMS